MNKLESDKIFSAGNVPITVVLITLNEEHNLYRCLKNLSGWANQVVVLDSFSRDKTIDICIENKIYIAQRKFIGFGDQWNAALNFLPIKNAWTMKIDPDEILSSSLKREIAQVISKDSEYDGFFIKRRLQFLGKDMPVKQNLMRLWKTGRCQFSNVRVNEHAIVNGKTRTLKGHIKHLDSPTLHHWITKQNEYTSAESEMLFNQDALSANPSLFGSLLERRMWFKKYFWKLPFRYTFFFLYNYILLGAFLSGREGYIWSWSRVMVMKILDYKHFELKKEVSFSFDRSILGPGKPDPRLDQV